MPKADPETEAGEARAGEALRRDLLGAALQHVPFDGWSEAALRHAAKDLELDSALALNAFPGGASELIAFYSEEIDRRTLEALEEMPLEEMKVREKIHAGVMTRLELLEPDIEAVRRGLSFLALPFNAPLATRLLYRTVDSLWYAAGDRATDYNFYTKRALLAGVYSSTLLFWLNDSSEEHAATHDFLDRRISEVLKVGGRLGKNMSRLMDLPDRLAERMAQGPGLRPGKGRSPLGRGPLSGLRDGLRGGLRGRSR